MNASVRTGRARPIAQFCIVVQARSVQTEAFIFIFIFDIMRLKVQLEKVRISYSVDLLLLNLPFVRNEMNVRIQTRGSCDVKRTFPGYHQFRKLNLDSVLK